MFNTSSIDTKSYAAFGQLTWNVTDRFKVTPGLRYTHKRKDAYYNASDHRRPGVTTESGPDHPASLGIARPQFYEARDLQSRPVGPASPWPTS